ncbi:MAG: hypothetical protein J6P83_03410 [Bacteroidales bacterium]|nr:hypothetical protein [Bacteroidales bacterium]
METKHKTDRNEARPQTVIAGLTRNLLSERMLSLRTGDGGCFSAMTVKGVIVVIPCLVSQVSKSSVNKQLNS